MSKPNHAPISRRAALTGTAVTLAATAAPSSTGAQAPTRSTSADQFQTVPTAKVGFTVNGAPHSLELDTRTTLLDVLRERLALSGTKKGCDHGQCGACTVIVNERRINSCLSLAVMHEGDDITTIEGLGSPVNLHPMQAAFVKHDGYQCGYCTPGQTCSAVAMLDEVRSGIPSHVSVELSAAPEMSNAEIRERMSGNICRCGAYSNIIEAITEVAGRKA